MENKKITVWELLDKIKDPRSPSGRRHPLGAILRMMLSGFLCGRNSTAAIVRWAKTLSKNNRQALGLSKIPSEGALSNLFAKMDIAAMEEVLKHNKLEQPTGALTLIHIAIDGKTIKGSAHNEAPAVHLLSMFVVGLKSTVKQHQQEEGENEITSALKLLQNVNLKKVVVSGDAIFAQKKYMPND
jgi:CHASE1-domain containing sensor protein